MRENPPESERRVIVQNSVPNTNIKCQDHTVFGVVQCCYKVLNFTYTGCADIKKTETDMCMYI